VVRLRFPTGIGMFQTTIKPWLDQHVGPMRHGGRVDGLWEAWLGGNNEVEFRFRTRLHAGLFSLRWRSEILSKTR